MSRTARSCCPGSSHAARRRRSTPRTAIAASRPPQRASASATAACQRIDVAHVGVRTPPPARRRREFGHQRARDRRRCPAGTAAPGRRAAMSTASTAQPVGDQAANRGSADPARGAGHERDAASRRVHPVGRPARARSALSASSRSRRPRAVGAGRDRRARRSRCTARTPPARSAASSRASGRVSPAAAALTSTRSGRRASSSEVSVRPACGSPSQRGRHSRTSRDPRRAASRPRARAARRCRRARRPARRGRRCRVAERHSSTTSSSSACLPDRQRAGESGVFAARAVGQRGRDHDVGRAAASRGHSASAMSVSVESGRCGPCCSVEPSGTASTRAAEPASARDLGRGQSGRAQRAWRGATQT